MKVLTRHIFLNNQDEKFFGEGPYRLLKQVEETGSLHAAAFALGMAYSKATNLLKNAEKSLGFSLTVRKIGGKAGGGSVLTAEAKDFLRRYELYREACLEYNAKQYERYFETKKLPRYGCVIMASGLGKRFGGDKLMAELMEKPMLQYIVEATEDLFDSRVVVTRNEKVKVWCEEHQITVVYHELPGRNDTIRLGLEKLDVLMKGNMAGCVFCPADMPFVTRSSLSRLINNAMDKTDSIIRMSYKNQVGSPVLFGKEYFDVLKNLPKGKGGSEVVKANKDKVFLVEAKDEYELWDMDTQEDFEIINAKMQEIMKK